MNKIMRTQTQDPNHEEYSFLCPGCKMGHKFVVKWGHGKGNQPQPMWSFNGNMEKPTFSPSLLNTWTYGPQHTKKVCHLFLREGILEFLNDCTHELAGKKVPLLAAE